MKNKDKVMKKAINLFVAIVVTIGAISVNASDDAIKVNVVGEKTFLVEVTNVQGAVKSYFKDDLGQVLYRKKSEESFIRFSFDLSNLKNGNYSLEIMDDYKVQILPVTIDEEGIRINEDDLQKTFFPTIVESGNEVIVKQIANEESDLYVNIRTIDGKLLLSDKVDGQLGLIGKRYHFKTGKYTVTMKSNDFAKTSIVTIR